MIIFAVIFLLLSIHQQVTSSKTQPQHLHTGQKPSWIFSFSKAIVIQLAYQKNDRLSLPIRDGRELVPSSACGTKLHLVKKPTIQVRVL